MACSLALTGLVLAIVLIPPPLRSDSIAAHRRPPGPRPTAAPSTTASTTPSTTPSTPATSAARPTSPGTIPPSTGVTTATGPGPQVAAITPDTGRAGERVTLEGAGLFSADGVMTLMFGSAQAPVSCPTQTVCQATVPAQAAAAATGPATVAVTLSTSAGTSRPVNFSYAG